MKRDKALTITLEDYSAAVDAVIEQMRGQKKRNGNETH